MIIYKDYTTFDLMMDKPCIVEDITIYPIKVKDYKDFQKYSLYLSISKERLKVETDYLTYMIISLIYSLKEAEGDSEKEIAIRSKKITDDICELLSICTRSKVSCIVGDEFGYAFEVVGQGFVTNNNFEAIRKVIMAMALIKEPRVFDDPEDEEWYYRALEAQQGDEKITFEDIIISVIQDYKISFEEAFNLNVFQIHSYFGRVAHLSNYETTNLFRTVSSKKLPDISFVTNGIDKMYVNDESGLVVDGNSFMSQF